MTLKNSTLERPINLFVEKMKEAAGNLKEDGTCCVDMKK